MGGSGGRGRDGTTSDALAGTTALHLTNVTQVSAGDGHTCAIQAGIVLCWGSSLPGALGYGDMSTPDQPRPMPVVFP